MTMTEFQQLYKRVLQSTIGRTQLPEETGDPSAMATMSHQLDCLLNPKKHPLIWQANHDTCTCEHHPCQEACPFDAIQIKDDGTMVIHAQHCTGCAICLDQCASEKLQASKDIIPALNAVLSSQHLTYALVAPAFLGQFSPDVTPGQLRSALKKVGFDGMLEVALFADILTLKEALEFDRNIQDEQDYQLTSCCCPIWIAMIRKVYNQLMPHMPGSVSPMIASGRAVKKLHPGAVTVFIGPCLAKKSEARDKDIADAVDYVLTFQEMQDIFDAMGIDPAQCEQSDKDHSSRAGRIYARAGGVSEAVSATLNQLNPSRSITIKTRQADGVKACKEMINDIMQGKLDGNFFEGMGCVGGCVGGPKTTIDREQGRINVEAYGDQASYQTPTTNPFVIELLHRLGFDTIQSLLEHSDIFTRDFSS